MRPSRFPDTTRTTPERDHSVVIAKHTNLTRRALRHLQNKKPIDTIHARVLQAPAAGERVSGGRAAPRVLMIERHSIRGTP